MIPLHKVYMSSGIDYAMRQTLHSGYIGEGPIVERFENVLGNYLGNPNVAAVNSGTSGLHLALEMLPKNGTEILTQSLTCLATNTPILKTGFKIRWVDADPLTCNMDLADLASKLNENTAAIMVTHWGGYPNDLDEIDRIRYAYWEKSGRYIPVIEDCAHAFGSEIRGKRIGSRNTCVFSFGPIKTLTCGDGGLMTFEASADRAKKLRWYGIDRKNRSESFIEVGHKFHMNDIAATIGIENFKEVHNLLTTQRRNARLLRQELSGVGGITLMKEDPGLLSSYWLFTILVENRTSFHKLLTENGIASGIVHKRNDKYPFMADFACDLPNLDSVEGKRTCLPVGWWVTEDEIRFIADCIKKGWQ